MSEMIYTVDVKWRGNTGEGIKFERSHLIRYEGRPDIESSADPHFMGDGTKHNPEELFLASLSSCHMLWYLYLCAEKKISVTSYLDHASVILDPSSREGGRFLEAELKPEVTITDPEQIDEAIKLQEEAHKKCYVANSVNFEVKITPTIQAEGT